MASTIKIKRSNVAGKEPTTSDIDTGELALNIKDQKLYSSNGSAVFQIGGAPADGAVTITTATVKDLTQNDTVVTNVSSYANSVVDNSLLSTKASWDALTSTNTAIRALANDRLQVANAAATYQTISIERAALANTNAYIASVSSTERSALANTNAYIATKLDSSTYTASDVLSKLTTVDGAGSGLDADLLDGQQGSYYAVEATEKSRLANTNAYIAATAATERSSLANTNSYIASVQSDVDANEATERAALANTNAYIASVSSTERSALANTNAYIATKADIASPTFTGTPAAPTASAGTNTTQLATTAFVRTEVANLVDSAPATLDTLNELAAALGDDPNFATTLTTNLGQKLGATASVTLTGDVTGSASFSSNAVSISTTDTNLGNTNAYIASVAATERSALANTNAYIATKLNASNPAITGTLTANGSVGTAGYVLKSSGSGIYWDAAAAGGGGAVTITTATVKDLTQNDTVVTNVSSYANSVVDNSLLSAYATIASPTFTGNATFDTSTLFVDGTNDRVGIGTTSPATKLHVNSGIYDTIATFESTDQYGKILLKDSTSTNGAALGVDGDSMYFEAGGSSRMRIDSAGNVGIGTSSPTEKLSVVGKVIASTNEADATTKQGFFGVKHYTNAEEPFLGVHHLVTSGTNVLYLGGGSSSGNAATQIRFFTAADTTTVTGTECMRINAGGDFFLGTTTLGVFDGIGISYDVSLGKYYINSGTNGDYAGLTINNTYNDNNQRKMIDFYHREVYIGDITTTNALVYYNTSSDYRLKENIVDLTGAIARLKQLQPRQFNFIRDPDTTYDGFIAHEVQEVVPTAASGSKDEVNADGTPKYQGIDQSKLVPLLTAALQEAISKIESLESRISALEGN